MAGSETGGAQTPRPVAVVTGAGGAIGHASAVALAAAGFDVCAVDLDRRGLAPAQAAVESAGGTCRAYVCDVTDPDLAEATVAEIFAEIADATGRSTEEVIGEAARDQPTGEFQSASQIGQRVAFLATSTGMRFTGTVLWCDSHIDRVPPS